MQARPCIQNLIQLAKLILITKNQNELKTSLTLLFSYPCTSQIDFLASVHPQHVDFFFYIPRVWLTYCNSELTLHLLCCAMLQFCVYRQYFAPGLNWRQ